MYHKVSSLCCLSRAKSKKSGGLNISLGLTLDVSICCVSENQLNLQKLVSTNLFILMRYIHLQGSPVLHIAIGCFISFLQKFTDNQWAVNKWMDTHRLHLNNKSEFKKKQVNLQAVVCIDSVLNMHLEDLLSSSDRSVRVGQTPPNNGLSCFFTHLVLSTFGSTIKIIHHHVKKRY